MSNGIICLRAASFNIRNGDANDGPNAWPCRRELVAQTIDALGADVVGLQEAFDYQLDELLPLLPQYACSGVGRDDGVRAGEFCAILFLRERWRVADEGTFWLSETPDQPGSLGWGARITRICSWVRLAQPGGRAVRVMNAHLDHETPQARRHGAELIAGRLGSGPLVLMGDLNAGEDEPELRYLKGELLRASDPDGAPEPPPSPLMDAFRAANPEATEVTTYHGFDPSLLGGKKIDYIFVRRCERVLSAGIWRETIGGKPPSDHFPVFADVELSAE